MMADLWANRYRHRIGTFVWLKSWAKRIVITPSLFRQWWIQTSLKSRGARLGIDCFVADRSGISGQHSLLCLGDRTFIGRVKIAVHDKISIGSGVCVNDETQILSASHDVMSPTWDTVTAPISIEDHAWVAVRCLILPGVTIGEGAVVGAGSVVTKDVAPFSIVAGNPAKPILKRRAGNLKYSPVDYVALFRAWKSV